MSRKAEIVFEFAYTTGELYPRHVELAKNKMALPYWRSHVMIEVIPRFKREMRLTSSRWYMPEKDINACAEMLQSYYSEHVKEL